MRSWQNPILHGSCAGLLGIAVWLSAASGAAAQSCSTTNGTYTCTVAAGTYSNEISISAPTQDLSVPPVSVTSQATVNLAVTGQSNPTALNILGYAGNGFYTTSSNNHLNGGDAQGMSISNFGALTLTAAQSVTSNFVFGVFSVLQGGNGFNVGYTLDNGGAGGNTGFPASQQLSLTNTAPITLDLANVTIDGNAGISGAALFGSTVGGNGGGGNDNAASTAGSGGQATGVTINNSGAINATLGGSNGFAGIAAVSTGGNAGTTGNAASFGGGAGSLAITNSAPVTVDWTWQNARQPNNGVFGILALSTGGNGSNSDGGGDGGDGGSGYASPSSASVTLSAGGDVTVTENGTPVSPGGGVGAILTGGNGGAAGASDSVSGGTGGSIGQPGAVSAQINDTDASVKTSGDELPGLIVSAQGGSGGNGFVSGSAKFFDVAGGAGGFAGDSAINVTASTKPVTISTAGTGSAGIEDLLQGGAGGRGGDYDRALGARDAGDGGAGGDTGQVTINLSGQSGNPITVSTTGSNSPGIYGLSQGAAAGNGGNQHATGGAGGNGGLGGHSWDVDVSLTSTTITTQGSNSPGIVAQSQGAPGGQAGMVGSVISLSETGGGGGYSRNVNVTLDSASSVLTQGTDSSGIIAQSLSGAGGNAQLNNGLYVAGGNGGDGGSTGTVTVTNNGTITTTGETARGILAQAMSGAGGAGGSTYGILYSQAGAGGSSGSIGTVMVTNNHDISTSGAGAEGILAQSIAGSGGAGGQAVGTIAALGGSASTNQLTGDAGVVSVNASGGSITTTGASAIGILGQSIGGGGGDGGGSSGAAVSIGASGGAGGSGDLAASEIDYTTLTTSGDGAHGAVMQSIGGGGGNGGNAGGVGLFASLAVGGSGGSGGDGGGATINTQDSTITTEGSKAAGLVVQSIGGGGGTGGSAITGSIGAGFSISAAVGGSGGNGGTAGPASSQMVGGTIATGQNPLLVTGKGGDLLPNFSCTSLPCNLLPVDDYGVLIQSIGGGGGAGGLASAKALAIAIPVTPEGNQISLSTAVALGGAGGNGGGSNYVTFAMDQGGKITTSGQGATGVLLQSIGGGGGAGGDSSALAVALGYNQSLPQNASSLSLTSTFTVGGSGGGGGNAGPAWMALGGLINVSNGVPAFTADPSGTPASTITTYGDYADAIKAQSIGGGGGDAGFGSGNTQSFGTGSSLSLSVTLGATGGSGGNGGAVIVQLFPTSAITTWGSNAIGVLAQSIGGGGGASQGGSYSFGGSSSIQGQTLKPKINVHVGTQGGSGGMGETVTVNVAAPIVTHGGDADGVLAQSIGGGGGLGGSAGSDASADNPIVEALDARTAASNILKKSLTWDGTFTVAVGGNGGSGNTGGTVDVNLSSAITTGGDWASGIIAQSIGGGGGKGGTAAATGTGGLPQVTINLNMAVGGTGGQGGNGGAVAVGLSGSAITTAGYEAAGIIAQSIGGGGGMGADGSDGAWGLLSVGVAGGGNGGASGSGNDVTLTMTNANMIKTSGEAADGVLLQSVGGGGGIAGAGSGYNLSVSREQTPSTTLSAGGGSTSSGAGGAVNFAGTGSVAITTTGNNAFGILAQSVGGGGGIVNISQDESKLTSLQTSVGGNDSGSEPNNNGGNVTVGLGAGSSIITSGSGAHGIVAQSIGGGGGIAGLPGTAPVLTTTAPSGSPNPANGVGGNVDILSAATISVSGAGAIGILAQSIGSGGGLMVESDGNTVFAGSPAADLSNSGGHGTTVDVTTLGPITANGANGIGIFAQSTGHTSSENGPISVTVGATVTGGGGTAATPTQPGGSAIQIDTPAGSNNGNGSQVTVNTGGSLTTVLGVAGTAVLASGGGFVNLTNYSTVTGSTYLGSDPGTFTNYGTYNSGVVVQGDLINSGTVNLGVPGTRPLQTTTVTDDFTQTSNGQLVVTVDSINKAASLLQVDGNASVGGLIVPAAITLLPGALPVVTAGSLSSSASGLDSLLFNWNVSSSGNTLTLSPSSNFVPRGVGLTASESSMANYLTRAWNNSDTAFATEFANLSRLNVASQYTTLLDAYSGKATEAQSLALANSAGAILGAAMSCPVFVDNSVLLGEDNCVWVKATGQWATQWESSDTQGYHVASATYRLGGQHEIVPDWYLGGSFAAGQTWATMNGTAAGSSSGYGQTFDGSIALKHTMGPWFFAGSIALASGAFHSDRLIDLPGASALLQSDPSIFLAGGRLRGGYEFTLNNWYVRPYGDLDVVYTHLGGFQESGPPLYALDVQGSSKTTVVLSPMVEFGGRIVLDDKTTLRPFAAVGVSILPNNTRAIDATFVGASTADGTFRSFLNGPGALGDLDLGVQVYRVGGFEVKAEYTANVGGSFASQGVSARLAYHF